MASKSERLSHDSYVLVPSKPSSSEEYTVILSDLRALQLSQSQLAATPSLLKEICNTTVNNAQKLEAMEIPSSMKLHGFQSELIPLCKCRRVKTNRQVNFLGLNYSTTEEHTEDCSLRFRYPTKTKCDFHWTFPNWLLAKTISMTFSSSKGAGGLSIEPLLIRARPIVEMSKSPAFLLMREIKKIVSVPNAGHDDKARQVRLKLKELLEIFRSGKSSPTDLEENFGVDILAVALILLAFQDASSDIVMEVIRFLFDVVPIHESASLALLSWNFDKHSNSLERERSKKLITTSLLKDNGYEFIDNSNIYSNKFFFGLSEFEMPEFFREWPEAATDCGPVSWAVINGFLQELDILIAKETPLEERNKSGQTPLHLAVGFTPGLKRLIEAGVDVTTQDKHGYLPLHYAILARCYEDVKLLLDAHSPLDTPPKEGNQRFFPSQLLVHLMESTDDIQDVVLKSFIEQREGFLASILSTLMSKDSLSLSRSLGDGVLDELGFPLAYICKKRGLDITQGLSSWGAPTVYHTLAYSGTVNASPQILQKVFALGFQDVDSFDWNGYTPLMISCLTQKSEFMKFFLQKDCDPLAPGPARMFNAWHLFVNMSCSNHSSSRNLYRHYSDTITMPQLPSSSQLITNVKLFLKSLCGYCPQARKPSSAFWDWMQANDMTDLTNSMPDKNPLQSHRDFQELRKAMSKGQPDPVLPEQLWPSYHPFSREVSQSYVSLPSLVDKAAPRADILLLSSRDGCKCKCSPAGCTATSIFSKSPSSENEPCNEVGDSLQGHWCRGLLFKRLMKWCNIFSGSQTLKLIHRDVIRLLAFEGYGLTHTCCRCRSRATSGPYPYPPLDEENRKEIEDEEEELHDQLEKYMESYDESLAAYEGPLEAFVEMWMEKLEGFGKQGDEAAVVEGIAMMTTYDRYPFEGFLACIDPPWEKDEEELEKEEEEDNWDIIDTVESVLDEKVS